MKELPTTQLSHNLIGAGVYDVDARDCAEGFRPKTAAHAPTGHRRVAKPPLSNRWRKRMPGNFGRLVYFLGHPSEYIGLWLLDSTVWLLALTLIVALRQLFVTQRQMEILVRQDELNREVSSRRIRLLMYAKPEPPGQLVVFCRNDGNKTAQNFYWHLSVPITVSQYGTWNSSGKEMLSSPGMESHDGEVYRHYTGFVADPLYPTRMAPVARIATNDTNLPLWWSTISEDGADPKGDGKMQRMA
jgi:hypothetical protein